MPEVGRNDPCPCGSGHKYKKCCLTKDEIVALLGERAHQIEARAVHAALHCLEEYGESTLDDLIQQDLLGPVRARYLDQWNDLDPDIHAILGHQLREWAVADGVLTSSEGVRQRALDLVLRAREADSLLQPDDRAWLAELGRRPLSLHQVGRRVSTRQVVLRDCFDAGVEPISAYHWRMHEIVNPGDFCIARVVRHEDAWYVTPAALPFHAPEFAQGLAEAFDEGGLGGRLDVTSDAEDAAGAVFLARRVRMKYLLQSWVEERLALDPRRALGPSVSRPR